MRKTSFCVLMIPLLLLTACQGGGGREATAQDAARQIRTEYLAADTCSGSTAVTADYGLRVYDFTMDFSWQREGETVLTLTAPEEIAGLIARVQAGESRLEYDSVSLGTGDLTGEGLTPMELIPSMMEYIQTGYMAECVYETLNEQSALRITYRDPETDAGKGVECSLWFDSVNHGVLRAELSSDGLMVLSSTFSNFHIGDDRNHGATETADLGGDQPGEPGT